jgi:uncharacterized membrane protein
VDVLALTHYTISKSVHVITAIAAFGIPFGYPVIQITAEKTAPRSLPFAWHAIDRLDRVLVTPLAVIVGLSGLYQWIDGNWSATRDTWLLIGVILYLVAFTLALTVFQRAARKAEAAAQKMVDAAGPTGDVELSDEYRQATKLPATLGPILGIFVIIIAFMMVAKPF